MFVGREAPASLSRRDRPPAHRCRRRRDGREHHGGV